MAKNKDKEYKRFTISTPWGYHPEEVEAYIVKLEGFIEQLNNKLITKNDAINKLQSKVKNYQEELRNMHIEMANVELPEAEEITQNVVLNEFANYGNNNFNTKGSFEDTGKEFVIAQDAYDVFNSDTSSGEDDDELDILT